VKRAPFLVLFAIAAVGSAQAKAPTPKKPVAPPPATHAPSPSPTPGIMSRLDPNVVEETATYVIRRYKKSEYKKVDDRHFKIPILGPPVEFFKEDDEYYYTSTPKVIPEEKELKRQQKEREEASGARIRVPKGAVEGPASSGVTAEDFKDLFPPRVEGRAKLARVAASGLPKAGMWRASFVMVDANGDGIPDIVAPPNRLGDGSLHVWLGDGKGGFAPWKITMTEGGKPLERFSIDYGGVACGDIDGDGHMDVVSASHGGGLVSMFGDGQGGFDVVRAGLPTRDFSSQAVVLVDANGDGKLDLVASRDASGGNTGGVQVVDRQQVRVYLFLGRDRGWEFKKDGIVGGFYSNSLAAFDYNGDGRRDVLTGSHYTGALVLLWKNNGDGTFSPVQFPSIEPYAYHFGEAPGTWGKGRAPAFADGFAMQANVPDPQRAAGFSVYAFENGAWTRHRAWRKHEWKAYNYAIAFGDLDGDGLDDLVFPDNEAYRLRILFQQADGTFLEAAEADEPVIASAGQCVRVADLDGDGKLDVVLSQTVISGDPTRPGGWDVFLNKR
jgi:hypothetical protein